MRWWSVANLVSNAGTWMQLTVQNLLVLQITGSAAVTGLSLAVQAAPGLLLGVVGGAVVDSWPRKVTATVSQAVLGLVALTTAALITLDLLSVPALLVLAGVTGVIATVDGPACALLGNDLVPREDVPSAISVGSVVHSVGRLGGTALAAVATAAFGTQAAYAANALSFLFVAAVIPFLKPVAQQPAAQPAVPLSVVKEPAVEEPSARRGSAGRRRAVGGTREGLLFFLGRRRLVALAVIAAVSAVLGRNYSLTLAALVTGPLEGGTSGYGTVATVLAVGGMLGALLAGRLRRPSVRLVAALASAGALLQAFAGASPTLALLIVCVAPMAIVEAISDTATTTVLQTDPPADMRGRVLGVWRSLSTAWNLAGPPLLGLFIQVAGARTALVAGGLGIAAVIGAGALVQARRRPAVERLAPVPLQVDGAPARRPDEAPELAPAGPAVTV
ncbi:MFS transporter [Allostreptomyces psammosilenae]